MRFVTPFTEPYSLLTVFVTPFAEAYNLSIFLVTPSTEAYTGRSVVTTTVFSAEPLVVEDRTYIVVLEFGASPVTVNVPDVAAPVDSVARVIYSPLEPTLYAMVLVSAPPSAPTDHSIVAEVSVWLVRLTVGCAGAVVTVASAE